MEPPARLYVVVGPGAVDALVAGGPLDSGGWDSDGGDWFGVCSAGSVVCGCCGPAGSVTRVGPGAGGAVVLVGAVVDVDVVEEDGAAADDGVVVDVGRARAAGWSVTWRPTAPTAWSATKTATSVAATHVNARTSRRRTSAV
jgi:hypothetical protein